MAVPQFNGEAHSVWIELDDDSGPLWAQIGPPPGRFIRFKPGAVSTGSIGQAWQATGGANEFFLRIEDGQLWIESGQFRASAGSAQPGTVEFSSMDDWAKIRQLRIENRDGSVLFEDDFRGSRVSKNTLDAATLMGGLIGFFVAILCFEWSLRRFALCLFLLVPPGMAFRPSRADWLQSVERLYLDTVAPSAFAITVLNIALIPLFCASLMAIIRGIRGRISGHSFGRTVWFLAAFLSAFSVEFNDPLNGMVFGVFGVTGAFFGWKKAPPAWWWIDGFGWFFWVVGGSIYGAAFCILWRIVSVAGTASFWLKTSPASAVGLLLIGVFAVPIGAEQWLRGSVAGDAWQMSRLSGERPNEKGWENPKASWTGECGDPESPHSVSIVVAGGSSVGGAYQFGGQPDAFFTAIAHQQLCESLPPDVSLRTHNFGDGDRNTFTISRTIEDHLTDANILVLYVGVNDVFTTQNTRTRKQREAEQAARSNSMTGLLSWVSKSRLLVGASLWLRATDSVATNEQVADVPIDDARENHDSIISAARSRNVRVLLMTEYVQQSQRNRLFEYANMQQSFENDDVRWFDVRDVFKSVPDSASLADRNHLSRGGNRRLGEALARELQTWTYGSKR
jgi:lysophospholipase L1-like esterase